MAWREEIRGVNPQIRSALLEDRRLTDSQKDAITSSARRLLVIAGAGSGKTDVMARRVAWFLSARNVSKDSIVAFTFTEAAAEELKFRIRLYISRITPQDQDAILGGMYIGTIHGFCLKTLRDLTPNVYYNYDIIDDMGRVSLIQRGFYPTLGLNALQQALGAGQFDTIDYFLKAYDLLNEYDKLDVILPPGPIPTDVAREREWIANARLRRPVGRSQVAAAFSECAARYYAQLKSRRFLDFSTSQSELTRLLKNRANLRRIRGERSHIVVDEVQDINPVQNKLVGLLVGRRGSLTAVGDHRQAIYAFRGGRVDLMQSLHDQLTPAADSEVIELRHNFRSTPTIINLANQWAATITPLGRMTTPMMDHGRAERQDYDSSHVMIRRFDDHNGEAAWIAQNITRLVNGRQGAAHDAGEDTERGIMLSDIAILVRTARDARTYQNALRRQGIHAVVNAGPDLFSQPEVLLFLGLLAVSVRIDSFFGRRMNEIITNELRCRPEPAEVVRASAASLRTSGIPLDARTVDRLLAFAMAIAEKLDPARTTPVRAPALNCRAAATWLGSPNVPRRIFPQDIFHWFLEEAGVSAWDNADGQVVMFHVGQLSKLITSIETPGWTTGQDFRYQITALLMWGASGAKAAESPLLTMPDAVTITTVHGAKGLEFPVVFLADVRSMRFPSSRARIAPDVPFEGALLNEIDPTRLADNSNLDGERRLMYVALTRAERYLFISCSGNRRSRFMDQLTAMLPSAGGVVADTRTTAPRAIRLIASSARRDQRLVTNFSELRYFLECPHDFYLRKVLGFAPTIDQAFGYGKGVHNILREVHKDPRKWARLAGDRAALEAELQRLVNGGLFYLRYTTGDPLENMKRTALRGVADYVSVYQDELQRLEFEPEQEFETLFQEENLLVSGAIDVVKMDDPPRVSIIDFKSGEQGDENQSGLSRELMALQIGVYGLAARHELEYEPQSGHIRYIGEEDPQKRQLDVALNDASLRRTRQTVVAAARRIAEREFDGGPTALAQHRCRSCDFIGICGRQEASAARAATGGEPRRRRGRH